MFKIQKYEVNIGRQNELDVLKGFLMILIIFIHSFQMIANSEAVQSVTYKVLFSFFMTSGACLYLFSMGFGSVFTRCNTSKDIMKKGFQLLWFQALSNVCYAGCMFVTYHSRNLICGEVEGTAIIYRSVLYSMLTFVNIFFIAGMGSLALAVYKAIKMPLIGYGISAVVVGSVAPLAAKISSDNEGISWILDMIFAGGGKVSFGFFPYLSFVFLGYIFATIIRRVDEREKKNFYKITGFIAGIIAVVFLMIELLRYPSIDEFYQYLLVQYNVPNLEKVVLSGSVILLLLAIVYGLLPAIQKWQFGYKRLCYLAKHISKYYAIHIGVYAVIATGTAFCGFSTIHCLLWSVLVLVITDMLVLFYVWAEKKIKQK